MTLPRVTVPPSLELLDVAGNGMACERFLWIRGLSDPSLPPKSRIDLLDDLQRHPGELLHLASSDGTTAAAISTVSDESASGSGYMAVHCRADPGEPILGDLVALASDRARASGVSRIRCGDTEDRPHMAALQQRHGFREFERWRRFHVDTADAPEAARLPHGRLPDHVRAATLAARPGLAEAVFAAYREGLLDATGDFPRPEATIPGWLHERDSSPVLGRELALLLLGDADEVLAMVELERLAAGSDRASVKMLAVPRAHRGRGYGRLAKQAAVEHARELGIRRLQTVNHGANVAILTLNQSLEWTEDPERVALQLHV